MPTQSKPCVYKPQHNRIYGVYCSVKLLLRSRHSGLDSNNFDFRDLPQEVLTERTKSGLPEELGNEAMTFHLVHLLVFDGPSPLGNGAAPSCPAEVVI
jgi:hypothetical protein